MDWIVRWTSNDDKIKIPAWILDKTVFISVYTDKQPHSVNSATDKCSIGSYSCTKKV